MTVIDSSGVVDYLLGVGAAAQVHQLLEREGELAAPDILVLEVLAVLRRERLRGSISESRAAGIVEDLAYLPLELFHSMPLRERAWSLHRNITSADGLFVALAEQLGEVLATKDRGLAAAAAAQAGVEVLELARR